METAGDTPLFINLNNKDMKKVILLAMAAAMMCGCEKELVIGDEATGNPDVSVATKKFTFTVKGDFGNAVFVDGTRGVKYLSGDDNQMTDLWVFDYVGDDCVQTVHQVSTDNGWGSPSMQLTYGTHHLYFVASRGKESTINEGVIYWNKPSDTFWKDYEVTVVNTSNGNRAVTLDRITTKLKVTITDEVPANMATLTLTPTTWYLGCTITTGEPAAFSNSGDRSVSVPASYVGTSGQLSMSVFGFSGTTEWTTSITVTAKDGDGDAISSSTISNAAFLRNRATEFSGSLFNHTESATVSVNDDWLDSVTGTF